MVAPSPVNSEGYSFAADTRQLPLVIVTGASSQIGRFLLPRLVAAGYRVQAWSRKPGSDQFFSHPALEWRRCDMVCDELPGIDAAMLIHLAPLWLLPPQALAGHSLHRLIALSSTSRFSKLDSALLKEQKVAARLVSAEEALCQYCTGHGIAWTVFRPTLVYGCGLDKNVSAIADFIQRYGFFPLAGQGTGLRQPVHADDLAVACLAALAYPLTYDRTYDLSGGETLGYRAMVERIFRALDKQQHIVEIPSVLFSAAVRMLNLLPAYRHLNHEMVRRINQDLCFDHTPATRDFGYNPRPFQFIKPEP